MLLSFPASRAVLSSPETCRLPRRRIGNRLRPVPACVGALMLSAATGATAALPDISYMRYGMTAGFIGAYSGITPPATNGVSRVQQGLAPAVLDDAISYDSGIVHSLLPGGGSTRILETGAVVIDPRTGTFGVLGRSSYEPVTGGSFRVGTHSTLTYVDTLNFQFAGAAANDVHHVALQIALDGTLQGDASSPYGGLIESSLSIVTENGTGMGSIRRQCSLYAQCAYVPTNGFNPQYGFVATITDGHGISPDILNVLVPIVGPEGNFRFELTLTAHAEGNSLADYLDGARLSLDSGAGTWSSASGILLAVPEPSTTALIASGLALIGLTLHRRGVKRE